jgi:hypothetical protein
MRRVGKHLALASALLLCRGASAQQIASTIEEFLAREVSLTPAEVATVARGEVVSKLLPTTNDRDVTAFGVVRIDVPRTFFEQLHVDFARSLPSASRLRFAIFSDPATLADVQGIQVTPEDFDELKDCRPNDCAQKVPSTDIVRLQAAIDWRARDATTRINDYIRQRVVEYVGDYRRRGNAAMVEYADRGMVQSGVAFAEMLKDETSLYRYVPSLQEHLTNYPNSRLPGAREVIYWAADQLPRMKPVLKIAHQIVYSPPELPGTTLVAGKLIYANHYFEAGLELMTAVERDAAGSSGPTGITLLMVRRYRFDQLPGGLLNIRGRVSGAVRDLARDDLQRYKADYERAFSASQDR